MKTPRWSIPALGAFFVALALLVAGCGSSGVPSNAVATVAGNPISTRAFDHWLYVDAKGEAAQQAGEPVIIPDPPNYTKCVAQVRSSIPSLKSTATAKIKSECKALFTSYTSQVMDFLIKAYWYQAEAHKQGITLTDAQVNTALAKAKKTEFKTPKAYSAFLTESGQTTADVLYRVRVNQVFEKLIKKRKAAVTTADIAAYYKAHKSTYGTPERRDMRIVLTKTAAKATAAKEALQKGTSWTVVAKQYSTDSTTKDKGGLLTDVTAGQQDAALSKAAFAAKQGTLVGPVKATFGYYIVEVTKILPSTQKSLAESSATIKSTLTTKAATAAETAIEAAAKKDYMSKTLCKATYSMADCSGYKAPKTTSTAATGASTTGATTASGASTSAATGTVSASASTTSSSTTTSSSSQ